MSEPRFKVLTKPGCRFCTDAKALLDLHGLAFTEEAHTTEAQIAAFKARGYATFPQVFDGATHVGGFTELTDYLV